MCVCLFGGMEREASGSGRNGNGWSGEAEFTSLSKVKRLLSYSIFVFFNYFSSIFHPKPLYWYRFSAGGSNCSNKYFKL